MDFRYMLIAYLLPIITAIPIIGGQRDAYGCLESAGYQWCESTEACQRAWDVPCVSEA